MARGVKGSHWKAHRSCTNRCISPVYPSDRRETSLEEKRNSLSDPVSVEMTATNKQRYFEEVFGTD